MLFIPFFFVETGMRLELAAFTDLDTWARAGLLLGVVLFGKVAAAWLAEKLFGYIFLTCLLGPLVTRFAGKRLAEPGR